MNKKALITGIAGQDGSYLAEFLLSKNYEVHGTLRRSSSYNTKRIDHIFDKLHLHYADITDFPRMSSLIRGINPDEIYHLAAMSHVKVSFDIPEYTLDSGIKGTMNVLESVKSHNKNIKVYNASSSEMFGASPGPQNEKTPFLPQSPYACAKVASHYLCRNYRESYNLFVGSGILFNHESERRGENFVTRKITLGVSNIVNGKQDKLYLGNLDARRDWGYAKEYVEAMWLMLQQNTPDDYVIGTGNCYTVKDFVKESFEYVGLDWEKYVVIDPKYFRPSEVNFLLADNTKAKNKLNWQPTVKMKELCKIMMDHDLEYTK